MECRFASRSGITFAVYSHVTCDPPGEVQAVKKQQCEQCIRAALTKRPVMDLQDLSDTALQISGRQRLVALSKLKCMQFCSSLKHCAVVAE